MGVEEVEEVEEVTEEQRSGGREKGTLERMSA